VKDSYVGYIKPIHKEGSMYDLDYYRGITLTSNVYKEYAKIIEQYGRQSKALEMSKKARNVLLFFDLCTYPL
jgi:hypothetical protein